MKYHREDIGEYIETIFNPMRERIRHEHYDDLQKSQFEARQTENAAALLPAEASAFIRHVNALTLARAQAIADGYASFDLPSGEAGIGDITHFHNTVLAARRTSFQGHAELTATRTGRNLGPLSNLLRSFEVETNISLLESKSILGKQTVTQMQQKSPTKAASVEKAALSPQQVDTATRALVSLETLLAGKVLWFLLPCERTDVGHHGSIYSGRSRIIFSHRKTDPIRR